MAFRSRLAGMAAAAALALPAAALIAALPGAAAQAATTCNPDQASITFFDGPPTCQSYGSEVYFGLDPNMRITQICAGPEVLVEVQPYGLLDRPIFPGQCQEVRFSPIPISVTALPF